MDSWTLGAGTEKLEHWLKIEGVGMADMRPATVSELPMLVEGKRSGPRT